MAYSDRVGHAGPHIPPEVAERLGYYVYLYIDPRNGRVFYVGKGQGRRVLAHLSARGESRKAQILSELNECGLSPKLEVLAHALPSEETALRIEAAVIDLLGLDNLANVATGWRSVQLGRLSLEDLALYYAAEPVKITDPVLLIIINKSYHHGMPAADLYDVTGGRWRLGPRRFGARFALAVFQGVVREVYCIGSWHPGGETTTSSHMHPNPSEPGRWEFTGTVADPSDRNRYHGRSVAEYLKRGARSPIRFVNC